MLNAVCSLLQVEIVNVQNGENAATEDGQLETLNKDGADETAKVNEYVCSQAYSWWVFFVVDWLEQFFFSHVTFTIYLFVIMNMWM